MVIAFLPIVVASRRREILVDAPSHFHAEYHGQDATFDFDGQLLEGKLDSRTAKVLIRK